ncbi:MAG: FIST C-terminal domain-containing protein [Actinomycetota bacterium]|nr:FIST C-terminal domain-containing protein [Actinomycetota bacterium]
MPIAIGAGLSTLADAAAGGRQAAAQALEGLGGSRCDVAVVFAAGAHLSDPEVTLREISQVLDPGCLVGCGAAGTLAAGREVEDGTSVAVWAAALGQGRVEAFHADEDAGLPDLTGASGAILIADPWSFPAEAALLELSEEVPALPLVGGLASARNDDGSAALFLGDSLAGDGAVGLRFDGVEMLPCVSQGAAPLGPELTITAAEGNVILELAGRPALEKLREVVMELPSEEAHALEQGLLVGLVLEPNKPEYVQGDFLVRGVLGADPETGTLAVGAEVRPGQVIRLHARDAESADRDLRDALGARRQALGGDRPAGALVFTCNGRGRAMFGHTNHDARVLTDEFGGSPAAGFFAAGEIGPVGGEYFLHGFTATVAVFGR